MSQMRNSNHMRNVDHTPLQGDRVRETCRGGITGHVQAIRHSAAGLDAQVFADGSLVGYWIPARDLDLVKRVNETPTPCTFLGWDP